MKKSLLSETLRAKRLAGLITESEYNEQSEELRNDQFKSLKEDKAYKDATNNELAMYISILSSELSNAGDDNDIKHFADAVRDLEEVKAELKSRKENK